MLSLFARAAAGRTLPRAVTSSVAVNKIANLNAVTMMPSYLPRLTSIAARGFVASALTRFPAASAKSSAAKKKTKKPAAKKKPAKKKPAKKPAAKKPAAKKDPTKKRKKTIKIKPGMRRPPGQLPLIKPKGNLNLTPEQKQKRNISFLRRIALQQPPKGLARTTWIVFVKEHYKRGEGRISDDIKAVSEKYRTLSESELEPYRQRARANKLANDEAYKAHIESYPPHLIYMANLARRRLKFKFKKDHYTPLKDVRQPAFPSNAYACFVKSRYYDQLATETHLTVFKSLSDVWHNMSDAQKEPFKKLSREQVEYRKKTLETYFDEAVAYWAQKGVIIKRTTIERME